MTSPSYTPAVLKREQEALLCETVAIYGSGRLSDAELLALVLGVSVERAQQALAWAGTLRALPSHAEDLLGGKVAAKWQALMEVNRRLAAADGATIRTPHDILPHVADMQALEVEVFRVLYLNTKHRVIAAETVSVGTLNASLAHPREVFKGAVRRAAAAIIVAHNHPSGDPTPSPGDWDLTQRLYDAGKILGIELLDHIVVGGGGAWSFKEHGWQPDKRV